MNDNALGRIDRALLELTERQLTTYAVFQMGVHRHACIGIFSTENGARDAADAAADAEEDDYHAFEVVPFELDVPIDPPPPPQPLIYGEAEALYKTRKGDRRGDSDAGKRGKTPNP